MNTPINPVVIDHTPLKSVKEFCYLGSIMSFDGSLDNEIFQRIAKASAAFGQLSHRLWNERGINLKTKISVSNAVVGSSLLYGCET